MWRFSGGQWVYVGGPQVIGGSGTYPPSYGMGGYPPSRFGAAFTIGKGGDTLYLVGGNGNNGPLNDVWGYAIDFVSPNLGQWTWKAGSAGPLGAGIYSFLYLLFLRSFFSLLSFPSFPSRCFLSPFFSLFCSSTLFPGIGETTFNLSFAATYPSETGYNGMIGARFWASLSTLANGNLLLFGGFGCGWGDCSKESDNFGNFFTFSSSLPPRFQFTHR